MRCPVCEASRSEPYREIDGVDYFRCTACGSLFADPDFLARVETGAASSYAEDYWGNELGPARERCFGAAVLRVAETIAYCRVPTGLSGIVCGGSYASPLGARGTYDDPRRDH